MKLPKLSRKCRVYSVQSKQKTLHFSLITNHFKLKRGFSLIELLVVISIIGILVAAATASWTNAQQKSRDSKRKSDLKAIQQALELYLQDNGTYPGGPSGEIQCLDASGPTAIAWGGNFSCFNPSVTYMNPLPKDPRGGTSGAIDHTYYYNPDPQLPSGAILKYTLSAGLENSNDPEYCTPGASPNCIGQEKLPCDPHDNHSYCVIQP